MVQIITNSNGGGGGVGVYKYKGSVQTYEDLPTSGMKIGDTYNVINEHTTAPVFPAGTNVAWTGTDWDALGGSIDLSEYQKKLVEGAGIDIDGDTNEISVESAVINGAAAGATAVQPGDDVSDLNNDAGYITSSDIPTNVSAFNNDAGYITSSDIPEDVSAFNNDAGYITGINSSDVTNALGYTPYNSTNPSGYITSSAVKDGTLTIQKNGTNVQTFSANQSSNATANISVPTDTSDLTNSAGFITSSAVKDGTLTIQKNGSTIDTFSANSASNVSVNITVPTAVTDLSDASNYQTVGNLVTDLTNPDDTHYPSAKAVSDALSGAGAGDMLKSVYDPNNVAANAFDYDNFINTPTIPSVIDDLTSLSTTDALSANQGKVLNDKIATLQARGRFLSNWNATTGLPVSFPEDTPYTYKTGDYFDVTVVGTTNYKPNGSSYTGTASTTVETDALAVGDTYIYDGSVWLLQLNHNITTTFATISGQPTDNSNLATALNAKQDTLTAGENIKISSNVISANNVFIITEDDVTVSTTDEYGVAPYNTSYYYTNIDISASAGIEWREGAIYTFVVNSTMVVASAYRNVRVKIGTGTYIPVMGTTASLSGSSYFTKTNIRQFQYSTKYEAGGALHLFTDSNTTYSAMSVAEGKTATATTVRGMRSDYLKQIIKYHSVDDTAYASSWNGVTDIAPSKNAVYDKIQSVVSSIPTVNNATLTIQKNGTNVQTFTANQSTNATANISVPTDTSDLTNGAGFITGITSGDVTTALGYTPANDSSVVKTSGNQSISGTKTFSTSPVVPSKTTDATNTGTAVATEAQVYKKQDKLTTQTAYTSKGTSTKVPTITTNTLGQVTGITETSIAFPVTSVNGNTGAVTVSEFTPGGTATTGYVVTKTAGGYEWAAPSGFSPASAGSTGQQLNKTAGGYDWAYGVSSGDSANYTIKVSSSAPASGTPNTTITFVTA